jgi:hypothetical protein
MEEAFLFTIMWYRRILFNAIKSGMVPPLNILYQTAFGKFKISPLVRTCSLTIKKKEKKNKKKEKTEKEGELEHIDSNLQPLYFLNFLVLHD